MSLAERKEAAQKEEEQKNKIDNGFYSVRLKDWKFGKSKGGKEMYTLTWKILTGLMDLEEKKFKDPKEHKGKERKTFYVVSQNWSLVALLDIVESAGADLEAMEEVAEIDDVFEEIEDTKMPKAKMRLEHPEGERFPKIAITDVEEVLEPKKQEKTKSKAKTEPEGEDEDDDDEVESPD